MILKFNDKKKTYLLRSTAVVGSIMQIEKYFTSSNVVMSKDVTSSFSDSVFQLFLSKGYFEFGLFPTHKSLNLKNLLQCIHILQTVSKWLTNNKPRTNLSTK